MLEIQRKTVQNWSAMLVKWNVQHKIVLPDGEELGALEVAKPKRCSRSPSPHPRGSLTDYFLPSVQAMKPGDVTEIKFGPFEAKALRGSISAWASVVWGKGAATTFINHESGCVEVMRNTL